MSENIEYQVKEALEEKGFGLNYDPESSEYRPWYKIPFKINFTNGKGIGWGHILLRRINIPTNSAFYKTIDKVAGSLLHETGHVDIFPVELPLLIYGFNQVADQFDDSIKGFFAALGVTAGYFFVVRELVVEGYNCVKYEAKKYLKLRWGDD